MLLSNREIRDAVASGELGITPFEPDSGRIQPASVDLRLDAPLLLQSSEPIRGIILDTEAELDVSRLLRGYSEERDISDGWEFGPGRFAIGQTLETIRLPWHLSGRVEGRSRLARLGIGVHITAPKIDPGFDNRITLEIFNLGPWRIRLQAGMTICTLLVERLSEPATQGYSGMFQGGPGATGR